MKKILLKINKIDELLYPVSGYILGLKNYSILFEKTYQLNEIKKILKEYKDKEVYVSLNRPILNNELKEYKSILKKLDNLSLSGIIVGDLAALTYGLKTNIIIDQMHLNNSYYTLNHFYNNGVYGSFLTNDITNDEITKIKENSKIKLFKQVFGYAHLSTSLRSFITNYFKHFNLKKENDEFQIKEEASKNFYPVIEDYFGSHILSNKTLNLLSYYDLLKIDYMVIDSYKLGDIKIVINAFLNKDLSLDKKINELYNADTGFIDKKTIYKVKKDDK